jgi:hypothetical protein
VYEIVRQQEKVLPAGLDLVFTAFGDELASLEPKRLEAIVARLLQKAVHSVSPVPPKKPHETHGIVKAEGK